MKISTLSGKNICILGYGKEGKAMAEALEKYAPTCRITIADRNQELGIKNYEVRSGETYLDHVEDFDILIKSPGIPPSVKLKAQSSKLTSPTQIFLDAIADSDATVIGITGSKGKSTTASLIDHIVKYAQESQGSMVNGQQSMVKSFLIGNIGEPAIAHIEDARSNTIFVQEMSSYQLMDLTVSPHIAVVTSFFPEHLDYHGSLEAYIEAKKHIARFQDPKDHIYISTHEPECLEIAKESRGTIHRYSESDAPVSIEETKLKGIHNLRNIAVAFLVTTEQCQVPRDVAIEAIKSFTPLKHRLESLGIIDGIEWVNDSISTTPQSAIAAIDALGNRVTTIILGGQDRGYDFSPLVERIKTSSINTVILLPDSGRTIGRLLRNASVHAKIIEVETIEEAVKKSKNKKLKSNQQPITLLSPAAPSYGHFKNFEERGERFKNAIC